MDKSIQDLFFFYKYIAASLIIVVMFSGELLFFQNYMSLITYNMLLLHKILIEYCMILHYQTYT